MSKVEEVHAYLRQHGLQIIEFSHQTPDVPSTAEALGCHLAEIAKTLLLFVGSVPLVVVTSGDMKVNSSMLKEASGLTGKVRFPDHAEVLALTGYAPGGVSPFLLGRDLKVLIDDSLDRFGCIYPAAGNDRSAVALSHDQLLQLTGGQCAKVCVQI